MSMWRSGTASEMNRSASLPRRLSSACCWRSGTLGRWRSVRAWRKNRNPDPTQSLAHQRHTTGVEEEMRVAEVMNRNVQMASPNDSLQDVAKRMVSDDI